MYEITNALRNAGYVNDYCIRQKPNSNEATLVVYFDSQACSNEQKRKQAINNIANKIDDLSVVDVARNELSGGYSTLVGITRQQRGIMGSIKLNTA